MPLTLYLEDEDGITGMIRSGIDAHGAEGLDLLALRDAVDRAVCENEERAAAGDQTALALAYRPSQEIARTLGYWPPRDAPTAGNVVPFPRR